MSDRQTIDCYNEGAFISNRFECFKRLHKSNIPYVTNGVTLKGRASQPFDLAVAMMSLSDVFSFEHVLNACKMAF